MTLLADPPAVSPSPEHGGGDSGPARRRRQWWQGWRVPLRLARRELRRRPGRTALVAVLVAVPVMGMALIDVQYRSRYIADNNWIERDFGAADAMASFYPNGCEDLCSRSAVAAALPGGSTVLWATTASLPLRTAPGASSVFIFVTSVDMTAPITKGLATLSSGRWPSADDEVAMPQEIIDQLGIEVGRPFTLMHQTQTFEVVGVINDHDGWAREVVAPGFDFSVVRGDARWEIGLIDTPDGTTAGPLWDTNPSSVTLRPAPFYRTSPEQQAFNRSLILGWLGGVLAMSVLGVVVAAAFAISGRRQLVALGQLSASGADQRTLSRTLGLQGTVTGAMGAAVGLLAAMVVHLRRPFALFGRPGGPTVVATSDIVIIALTAVAVATAAALAPTRSLAKVSVLSALAGRRPVGKVPAGLVRRGAALFGGGVVVVVIATRAGTNGGGAESGMLVALGLIAAVLGVCALSPLIVDRLATLAAGGGASLRLAARGVARHRPRAAAVFASLLIVGMATTGVAALVEHNLRPEAEPADPARGDMVLVEAIQQDFKAGQERLVSPVTVPDLAVWQGRIDDAIAGEITWASTAVAYDAATTNAAQTPTWILIADRSLLDLLGVPTAVADEVLTSPAGMQLSRTDYPEYDPGDFPVVTVPDLRVYNNQPVVAVAAAEAMGLTVVEGARWYGIADHDLTAQEARAVQQLTVDEQDGFYYSDGSDTLTQTSVEVNRFPDSTQRTLSPAQTRWVMIGSSLLLVTLLVAFGMALWAVEGRDERDILVAVGASPATLARVAAWRAGGLTLAAMVLAVPAGIGIAWMISAAAGGDISVPWMLAAALLLPVPLVIWVGAWGCSAVAQRIRPVRMSSLTVD